MRLIKTSTKTKVKDRNEKPTVLFEQFVKFMQGLKMFSGQSHFYVKQTIPSAIINQEWVNLVNGNIPLECRLKSIKSRLSDNESFSQKSENVKHFSKNSRD